MASIKVSPEQLEGEAAHVKTQAGDLQSTLAALHSRLLGLTDVFTGAAQEAFTEKYDAWDGSAKQMMDALDQLGGFLDTAAKTIRDTDTQLANALKGS